MLTYVLAAVCSQPFADELAFKGGTALRKLMFGAEGRFSVDLDFLGARLSDDEVLAVAEFLDGLDFHGVRLDMGEHRFTTSDPDHHDRPTPAGFSATFGFACELGRGGLGLDISGRRPAFLSLRRLALRPETYHRHMTELTLPEPLALAPEENAAEKVSALLRRLEHGNAKDVYDLWLYLGRPFSGPLLRRLIVLTLWLDRRALEAGAPQILGRLEPRAFRWEELAGLLPRRRVDPVLVCRVVRERLTAELALLDADETALLEDARSHRRVALFTALAESLADLEGSPRGER